MSSTNERAYSDEEWKEIREGWAANHAASMKVLRLVQRDYKPGSANHKRIEAVIERGELEIALILLLIDKLRDIDRILYRSKVSTNA